jgi:DNA-binding GntR family transcriptional regulator
MLQNSHASPSLEAHSAAPKTLAEGAYLQLRRDIIEGVLPPGSKLRVEHLKDYAVGAGTLREALALLVADSLVVAQGQRGFRVAPISLHDIEDITRTRIILETEALRQSISQGDGDWSDRVQQTFTQLSFAERGLADESALRFNEWEACNRAFHASLISACPSPWIHHFLGILYQQSERYRRLVLFEHTIPRDIHAEHVELFEATIARDANRATQLLAIHINLTFQIVGCLPAERFRQGEAG